MFYCIENSQNWAMHNVGICGIILEKEEYYEHSDTIVD